MDDIKGSKLVKEAERRLTALQEQVQQALEAKSEAERVLLEAMLKAEQDTKAEAEAQEVKVRAKTKAEPKSKSVRAMRLPRVESKIMERSYQRGGSVAGGTLLSSGSRQATVTFKPGTFRLLELAAADNRVSLSEIVRQLVNRGLRL